MREMNWNYIRKMLTIAQIQARHLLKQLNSRDSIVLSRYSGYPNARPNRSLYLEFIIASGALFKICVIHDAPYGEK
jgi:hypothetical protein